MYLRVLFGMSMLAVFLPGFCASEDAKPPKSDPVTPSPDTIPMGINTLEGFDADLFHYSDQGSGFFPLSVVRALNDSDTGRPFLENLERFGLVPGQKSARNPEGFPVGIVKNTIPVGDRKIDFFGFTCAACHTSDLHYNGQVVRVEGGSGLFYVDKLGDAIAESLEQTLKDPEEFWAFLKRLTKQNPQAAELIQKFRTMADLKADGDFGRAVATHLSSRLEKIREEIRDVKSKGLLQSAEQDFTKIKALASELAAKSTGEKSPLEAIQGLENKKKIIEDLLGQFEGHLDDLKYRIAFLKIRHWLTEPGNRLAAGYGRADDFGTARVELFAGWNQKNLVPVNAPVSTPPLWKIDKYEWLHWNANSNSVIQRSIGESIGVGATFDAESFATSVNIVNQMLMERQIQKITPPQWPAGVFGAPDAAQVARGEMLYKQLCADCHTPAGVNDQGLIVVKLFTLDKLKTDPLVAKNFDRPVYKADGSTVGFAESIATLLEAVQEQAKSGMSPEHRQLMNDLEQDRLPVKWRDTMTATGGPVYPGRPLEGIWATAPYLHNGSVPTLYHLLLPAAKRPQSFVVGSQEFDPKSVGFVWEAGRAKTTAGKPLFTFDTTIQGNWNKGHEYGTDLAEVDRWALVEYLKVHKDPPPPKTVVKDY